MPKIFRHLYFWVVVAITAGAVIGFLNPPLGESLRPLGDGFIALVKMLIGPIIFCTVVTGIAGAGDMKKIGRIGAKTLLYFEVISTFALAIGLIVANVLKPGQGFNADVNMLDTASTLQYTQSSASLSTIDFLMRVIPKTFVDAFTASGDLLQVLLLAVLFGWAMIRVGPRGRPILALIESVSAILFSMIGGIMKLAPIGAGAAMAFTIGKFGLKALLPLASLMGAFYLTCGLFIILVLGPVAAMVGFNILSFLRYIRQELLLVLGTSSSESALVPLMQKLERLGCPQAVVGLVVPSGYSFNLDGTNIYMTLSALFIAQAFNVHLSLGQQLSLLAIATMTSKGASGVTGAGFITLAATLAVVPQVPIAGLALILGVDRFMSEARALTNIIGNGVATLVISRWENELDVSHLKRELQTSVDLGIGTTGQRKENQAG
jgi:aerobic C4-dicarboxylate transport protein